MDASGSGISLSLLLSSPFDGARQYGRRSAARSGAFSSVECMIDGSEELSLQNASDFPMHHRALIDLLGARQIRALNQKNRSFYELDVLFEQRVSARHFKKTAVETSAEGVSEIRRI